MARVGVLAYLGGEAVGGMMAGTCCRLVLGVAQPKIASCGCAAPVAAWGGNRGYPASSVDDPGCKVKMRMPLSSHLRRCRSALPDRQNASGGLGVRGLWLLPKKWLEENPILDSAALRKISAAVK